MERSRSAREVFEALLEADRARRGLAPIAQDKDDETEPHPLVEMRSSLPSEASEVLPDGARMELGLPEGSTYAEAVAFLRKRSSPAQPTTELMRRVKRIEDALGIDPDDHDGTGSTIIDVFMKEDFPHVWKSIDRVERRHDALELRVAIVEYDLLERSAERAT